MTVGAPRADDARPESAVAYVVDAASGRLLAELLAPDGASGADLGVAVAVAGEIVVAGAPGNAANGLDAGAAWTFDAGAPLVPPPCPADVNGDGEVAFDDILTVVACWGPAGPGCLAADALKPADGTIDFDDLLVVLSVWEPCGQ